MKISHSEVQDYALCKRRHYYRYIEGIDKIDDSSALFRGTVGHAALQGYYGVMAELDSPADQKALHDEAVEVAFAEFRKLYKKTVDDGKHMPLEEILFDWYFPNEPFVQHGWQILAVEKKFQIEIEKDLIYPFTVDLVAYDRNGNMTMVDHKFVYDFYGKAALSLNPQLPRYVGGMRALGFPVTRAYYNEIRTRPMGKAHTARDRLTQDEVILSQARMDKTWDELYGMAVEIKDLKSALDIGQLNEIAFRTANEHTCKNCPFRLVCEAELNDENPELIRKSYYRKADERYQDDSE
jgi:hypothetical protein